MTKRAIGSSHWDLWTRTESYWVKSLGLVEKDREKLRRGVWLNAAHTEASMTLIKQSFPEMSGLQSTFYAVSSIRKFSSQPEGSIQIHHDQDRSHWATSCYVGEK